MREGARVLAWLGRLVSPDPGTITPVPARERIFRSTTNPTAEVLTPLPRAARQAAYSKEHSREPQ